MGDKPKTPEESETLRRMTSVYEKIRNEFPDISKQSLVVLLALIASDIYLPRIELFANGKYSRIKELWDEQDG